MSSRQIAQLQAEVNYYRDRSALLRAKLYRWGLGTKTNDRLQEYERELARAEQRLRIARVHAKDGANPARSRRIHVAGLLMAATR
jgi:hypothetical protein